MFIRLVSIWLLAFTILWLELLTITDLSIVHGIIFILPCIILMLFKCWSKLVAKKQAELISAKLNEELVKLVWRSFAQLPNGFSSSPTQKYLVATSASLQVNLPSIANIFHKLRSRCIFIQNWFYSIKCQKRIISFLQHICNVVWCNPLQR